MKKCTKCKEEKKFREFNKDKYTKTGYTALCRSCTKEKSKKDKKILKNSKLKILYGITLEDYNNLLLSQNNCCAICSINIIQYNKSFSVDHCHKTGKIRGLLCNKCNQALGLFNDNTEIIENAAKYLKQ